MMLWSDNITRAGGEICLEMFGIWQPTQFRQEKKNLLTFSATANACLKQKLKRKETNKGGWILSGCRVSAVSQFKAKDRAVSCKKWTFCRVTLLSKCTV